MTIPGVGRRVAEVLIAEVGLDMTVFPTAGHLASWAGICPGNNSSGGKRRPGRTRHGSMWLRIALTEAAQVAARGKAKSFPQVIASSESPLMAGVRAVWARLVCRYAMQAVTLSSRWRKRAFDRAGIEVRCVVTVGDDHGVVAVGVSAGEGQRSRRRTRAC